MIRKQFLDVVEASADADSIVTLGRSIGPYDDVPKGDPETNLHCGGCDALLLAGWSTTATKRVMIAQGWQLGGRLLGRCVQCQALNLIPSGREKTMEEIEADITGRK